MKKPILPSEIVLRFHPSKFLWGWWLLFSIVVLVSLWTCLPLMWAASITLIYSAACIWQWMQLVGTHWKLSVQTLKVDVFGQMFVTNKAGQRWRISILPDTVVHPMCMVVHIRYQEVEADGAEEVNHVSASESLLWRWMQPKRLLILFDHSDAASQQALRVWLKWGLRD